MAPKAGEALRAAQALVGKERGFLIRPVRLSFLLARFERKRLGLAGGLKIRAPSRVSPPHLRQAPSGGGAGSSGGGGGGGSSAGGGASGPGGGSTKAARTLAGTSTHRER